VVTVFLKPLQTASRMMCRFWWPRTGLSRWANPPPNTVKNFATLELPELLKDRFWLARVTNALNPYWQRKNAPGKTG
jgi:hypothetical protein